jgi:hypothetical protein
MGGKIEVKIEVEVEVEVEVMGWVDRQKEINLLMVCWPCWQKKKKKEELQTLMN